MIQVMRDRRPIVFIATIMILTLTLSSCDTLRRKFTRKKKGHVEDIDYNPVLEPQEYPAPENNPVESYKQHYALLKVWYTDLWSDLQDKASDKKMTYTVKQLNGQIDEMERLVNPEKQADFNKLRGCLTYIKQSLDQPSPLRNRARIESDLRSFYHQLLTRLTLSKVKSQLVGVKK